MNVTRPFGRARLVAVLSLLFLVVAASPQTHHAYASVPKTGVIIPLYAYPGSSWASVVQAKQAHPDVPFVVVINPDSGPGPLQDPNYAHGIQSMQSAGIVVLGYVYTSYAMRPTSYVIADVSAYKALYRVNGIFFDQMSNVAGNEGYYSYLSSYAKSIGLGLTVGNPGTDTLPSYIGTVDTMVTYENAGLPSLSYLAGWHSSYGKLNFASISYGVASNPTFLSAASSYVGYVYITDGTMPNPYSALPSYFSNLVASLDAPQPVSLTVVSSTLGGSPLDGLWITVQSNGATLGSGFTPFTFNGTYGQTYTVTASSYQNDVFDHWSAGPSGPITVTLGQKTVLTALYRTSTMLTVSSASLSGKPLTGLWTVIQSNGAVVATGFTPLVFNGVPGAQYTVSVANYQKYVFQHWQDGGTNPVRTVVLAQSESLTAVFAI
ncbi:MAG: spherulation-specific family 4 protein [Thaumarchaeota archaeon]|nr:spherulation-specific family 4 protein [Nitrososphaerota archaeon]